MLAGAPPLPYGGSPFGPPATQNPFWLCHAPRAPRPSSCAMCQGAIGRGQATVTSECNHTFHLRCISGSVCPVCSARWRDEVTVTPSQPRPLWFPLPTDFDSPPRSLISAFSGDEPVEQVFSDTI